jgi:hypothetical protein
MFVQRFNPVQPSYKRFPDSLRDLNHFINDPPGRARERLLYTMFILLEGIQLNFCSSSGAALAVESQPSSIITRISRV